MALLIIIVGIVARMTDLTSRIWQSSTSRIQTFQEARAGFEAMTRKLSQATLNTYYDYYNASDIPRCQVTGTANLAAFVPTTYDRYSEMQFISGQANAFALQSSTGGILTQTHAVFFQAPLGYSVSYQLIDNAINACGYFLQFGPADTVPPPVLDAQQATNSYKPRYRFRLMEMTQPTEQLAVYSGGYTGSSWFVQNAAKNNNSRVIAENVIALVLLPKLPNSQDDPNNPVGHGASLAPNYNYNSRVPLGAAAPDPGWPGASPPFPGDSFTAYSLVGGTSGGTRHAQIPPMMHLVMIAIDEISAARLQGGSTTVPPGIDLTKTTLFTDATMMAQDIQSVEDICNAKAGNPTNNKVRLTYRVFSSDIIMRDAKWSNN
jgi:uncharacterized protein (TIGR02599 family)